MATVLLSNDDGYDASGLRALADALRPLGRVVVVAPDRNRSGSSHAMTLHYPVRVEQLEEDRYRVDGTPTDCVNLGIVHLLREARPDLVVSGINRGYNLGDDVTYSGTVAAALEALLLGVPAIAVSRSPALPLDYAAAASIATRLARETLRRGLPPDTLLNVNVPAGGEHPVRITRQGRRVYEEGVEERRDPKGRVYYWIGGGPSKSLPDPTSDLAAVERGEISVTPLHCDWTNHAALERLRGWDLPFAAEAG